MGKERTEEDKAKLRQNQRVWRGGRPPERYRKDRFWLTEPGLTGLYSAIRTAIRASTHMPFTLAILATILGYTWVLEPRGVPVAVPAVLVVSIALLNGWRSGEWGLSPRALLPAARAAVLFTAPAVLVVLGAGMAFGTLHDRGSVRDLAVLIPWGAAQQWVLQTVVLREARRLTSPKTSIVVASALFALVHAPNPFLMLTTFAGALGWCAIFARYANILPLGISHAIATLALLYAFDDGITGRLRIGDAYLRLTR